MTHKRSHRKFRSLYIWHRYIGIAAALFVLILSITGIMLNHTGALKLDSSYVESDWLLDWYGIKAPENIKRYAINEHAVTQIGEQLYWNNKAVSGEYPALSGLLTFPRFSAIAVQGEIILITNQGEIIERLSGVQGVPSGLKRIGIQDNGTIVIESAHGYYLTDQDFLDWKESEHISNTVWSVESPLTATQLKQAVALFRNNELPMERVMLDLHSGRLLGSWGPVIMDIAAIMLVFLSVSGLTLWIRQVMRRRQRLLKKHHHTNTQENT